MKLVNNNISPLAFYDDINLQNHRKSYAFGHVFPLITCRDYLLPFQFTVKESFGLFVGVYLINCQNGAQIDITKAILGAGLILKEVSGLHVIEYLGLFPLGLTIPEGLYYIEIVTSKMARYYSEVFCVKNNVDDCILLEWGNSYNFEMPDSVIDFEGFKFKCYLQTQIGKPEYTFEEEATERMGYTFVESQISKKTYKFTFLAPEYLCDALRIVRLCDFKLITQGNEVYSLTTFSMEAKWQEQGDLASVEAEFDTSTVIANLGGYSSTNMVKSFSTAFNHSFK